MRQCPYCGTSNRAGAYFCDDCGQPLHQDAASATLPTRQIDLVTSEFSSKARWGTAHFAEDALVLFHIRDVPEPIAVQPHDRLLIGRADAHSDIQPDLDLTPYGAMEKGVSRSHAMLFRTEDTLTIIDLGSANGTHLNGQRLVPEQPRVLRDGDEIRFGKLVAHIYFKTSGLPG